MRLGTGTEVRGPVRRGRTGIARGGWSCGFLGSVGCGRTKTLDVFVRLLFIIFTERAVASLVSPKCYQSTSSWSNST